VLRIAAFCVTEMAPDTIKTSLSKVVPTMVPSQIIVKDALPLNPNGKIDRNCWTLTPHSLIIQET
jgi:D-alanine--poly(phosphoribitol) ligase subunit 1